MGIEPKKQVYVMEFLVRSAPTVLYNLISTPSGFSEWFCDDVNVKDDNYSFEWDGETEVARCVGRKQGELIRFHWEDDDDPGSFFELRIRIDAMTQEVALVVTDHAWPREVESGRNLWSSQIATLQRVLGA
ncbi:MAG: SRPBCC domain-containing protein [Flavobacteriales bacterium]|nr:SRPBCC domain-containing protein [Flavobacteriales bacterium]